MLDYISGADNLKDFYKYPVTIEGVLASIEARKNFSTNRQLLVSELKQQYKSVFPSEKVNNHIELLLNDNTFTICTAHQPNIFTGHLYFIYKILHTIRLASYLNQQLPENSFVPVYYMGSEDADLEELGHIFLNDEKLEWSTNQTGAVGRMIVDEEFLALIENIHGRLSFLPFGSQLTDILKEAYQKGTTVELSTFKLVHSLFERYGLVILLPDNRSFKIQMIPVFKEDLFVNTPAKIVENSAALLSKHYPVQATARDINLFYMAQGIRNRIIKSQDRYLVKDTNLSFSEADFKKELNDHPERFSPNVILRGLMQETILPNITFIGGGGELAYWLELKTLFEYYKIPFPMLVLRNSFVYIDQLAAELMVKNKLSVKDIFKSVGILMSTVTKSHTRLKLSLAEEKAALQDLYTNIHTAAAAIDHSLGDHVSSLLANSLKKIVILENKMLRAEKSKYQAEERQLTKIHKLLFPGNHLQERIDNFMPYYAQYGDAFFDEIYHASNTLEQKFTAILKK